MHMMQAGKGKKEEKINMHCIIEEFDGEHKDVEEEQWVVDERNMTRIRNG